MYGGSDAEEQRKGTRKGKTTDELSTDNSFRNLQMAYTQRKHTNKAKTGNTKHPEKNMTQSYIQFVTHFFSF